MITKSGTIYEHLLVLLQDEFSAGRQDEQVADDLRDQMDDPWYSMSDEEHDLLNNLSGDLFLLSRDFRPVKLEEGETVESLAKDALKAIRKLPNIDPHTRAAIFGELYTQLGLQEAGQKFKDFASGIKK